MGSVCGICPSADANDKTKIEKLYLLSKVNSDQDKLQLLHHQQNPSTLGILENDFEFQPGLDSPTDKVQTMDKLIAESIDLWANESSSSSEYEFENDLNLYPNPDILEATQSKNLDIWADLPSISTNASNYSNISCLDNQQAQIGPLCYCGDLLQVDDVDFDFDWRCKHCFNTFKNDIRVCYWCYSGKACKYNAITDSNYNVCQQCFNKMDLNQNQIIIENNLKDTNMTQFIMQKIKTQIQYITDCIVPTKESKSKEVLNNYLAHVYVHFFENFINQLQNDDDIDNVTYEQIAKEFNDKYTQTVEMQLYT